MPNGGLIFPPDITTLTHRDLILVSPKQSSAGSMASQQAAIIATSEVLLPSSQLRRFGHGLHFSRNTRVIWSWKGLTRYETTVRGFVWMKTSTGMPGTSFSPFRRAISASDTLIRTV